MSRFRTGVGRPMPPRPRSFPGEHIVRRAGASESRFRRRVLDQLCDPRTTHESLQPARANNGSSLLLALKPKESTDPPGDPLPVLCLERELFTAAFRDRIVFRLAIVFRRPPV